MAQALRSEYIRPPRFPEIRASLTCFKCKRSLQLGFFSWKFVLNPETCLHLVGCMECVALQRNPTVQDFFMGQYPSLNGMNIGDVWK